MWSSSLAPRSGGEPPLQARTIGRFVLPLMLNAWLMTLAGPVLNVAIGRAPEPRLHLAAFWIAFTILLVTQSACLVLQQVTASALLQRVSLVAIALSGALLGLGASLVLLAIARTSAGDLVFLQLIPTPARTAHLAREVLAPLALVPLFVSLRGLANGVAVFERRTGLPAAATLVRLIVLAVLALGVMGLRLGAGAVPAAWMLVGATASEAIFLGVATLNRRRVAGIACPSGESGLAFGPVLRLALPLAAASLVWTAGRPLVGAVLARMADPDLAQAGFGVAFPILMVTCAPLWAFLEVGLVLPRTAGDLRSVMGFAAMTSLAFTAALLAVAGTPLRELAVQMGARLPLDLQREVLPALGLIAIEPLVLSTRAIAQGLLLRSGRTGLVLALSPVKLTAMLGAGLLVVKLTPHANGAVLALGLFIGGDAVDALLFGIAALRVSGALMAGREPADVPGVRWSDAERGVA